jgi:ribonuclease E
LAILLSKTSIMDIRKNNLNDSGRGADTNEERLEGFAASEMADRGPKDVLQDRSRYADTDAAAIRPVHNADDEEGDEDYDDEDADTDDLVGDDVAADDDELVEEDFDDEDLDDIDLDEDDEEDEDDNL